MPAHAQLHVGAGMVEITPIQIGALRYRRDRKVELAGQSGGS
jgi:hypothetical protein